jgi:hypothetical protein
MNRRLAPANFYVGMVVQFAPPVSGGVVVAVVTKVINRTTLALRITDGTRNYPTGTFTTTSTGWIS